MPRGRERRPFAQRGSAVAETAIALPLAIGLVFATFAVAWAATAKAVVMAAARDAARVYAAHTWDDPRYGAQGRGRAVAEATARAQDALRLAGFNPGSLQVTLRHGAPGPEYVTAEVTYLLNLPFGGAAGILRGVSPTWNLTGRAVARLERQELFR
ncbi:MAG: pilus assembly protein [Firmicutes bacterium]|nr:pilus assembly protein [Bacillota bacterium]